MMTTLADRAPTIAKLFRLLASEQPNEVLGAVDAIEHALKSADRSLYDLADAFERIAPKRPAFRVCAGCRSVFASTHPLQKFCSKCRSPIAPTLAKMMRLLASDRPQEVVAAAQAMQRVLSSAGLGLHSLADVLEHMLVNMPERTAPRTAPAPPPPPMPHKCAACGTNFITPWRHQKFCSNCFAPKGCIECGTLFRPRTHKQKFCGESCRKTAWLRDQREAYQATLSANADEERGLR